MTSHRARLPAFVAAGLLILLIAGGLAAYVLFYTPSPAQTPPLPTLADPHSLSNNRMLYYRSRGALSAALYEVEAAALLNGWSATLHGQAADLWRDMGQPDRALAHRDAQLRLSDNPSPELVRRLAAAHLQRGNWSQAWQHIDHLLALAPSDAWGVFHAGALLAASDPVQARDYLERAFFESAYSDPAGALLQVLSDTPPGALAGNRAGAVLAEQNLWALSEHAFRYVAIAAYPAPEAMAYTALMRAEQGKRGSDWLNAALQLAPDDADVRYVEGVYWRVQNDLAKSRNALELAISIDPDNPFLLAELGLTEQLQGNLTRAESLLQEALRLSGNDDTLQTALQNFYNNRAYLLPDDYLALVQSVPADDPAALSARGWALHVAGDTDTGLETVNQALALDPQNPRALFDRARILLETGQTQQAEPLFRQLASGDSPYAQAAERLLDRTG